MTNGAMKLSRDRLASIEQSAKEILDDNERHTLTELQLSGDIYALLNHIRYTELHRDEEPVGET